MTISSLIQAQFRYDETSELARGVRALLVYPSRNKRYMVTGWPLHRSLVIAIDMIFGKAFSNRRCSTSTGLDSSWQEASSIYLKRFGMSIKGMSPSFWCWATREEKSLVLVPSVMLTAWTTLFGGSVGRKIAIQIRQPFRIILPSYQDSRCFTCLPAGWQQGFAGSPKRLLPMLPQVFDVGELRSCSLSAHRLVMASPLGREFAVPSKKRWAGRRALIKVALLGLLASWNSLSLVFLG